MAALVFTLVGFPLGIRTQRGGRAVALTSSFLIVFSYYIVFNSLEGLALNRRLPVALAMWLPNLGFGLLGFWLIRATMPELSIAWRSSSGDCGPWSRDRSAGRVARAAARPRRPWRLPRPRASTFIIDRYLVRQFLLFVALGILVGGVIFVVVDLLQTLDRFLRIKPSLCC